MKAAQYCLRNSTGWLPQKPKKDEKVQLLLVFASMEKLSDKKNNAELKDAFPNAIIIGCSTAGEIADTHVYDDSLVATALQFEKSSVRAAQVSLDEAGSATKAGELLATQLADDDLRHIFVLCDGINVNGSELVKGLRSKLPHNVSATGGLAGDGGKFEQTLVQNNTDVRSNIVAAVGFFGDSLQIGYGTLGGWDQFGPERVVTRSSKNILHELDDISALQLYKQYLGEHASGLPATGLLFPLSIRPQSEDESVVRTILGVDEEKQSLTFAGNVPEGYLARLMKANFNRLVDGAAGAAKIAVSSYKEMKPEVAILISCVGRKMVLKQRIEEEVEAVQEILGKETVMSGFYSYGEISPQRPGAECQLHNQTMTITLFREK